MKFSPGILIILITLACFAAGSCTKSTAKCRQNAKKAKKTKIGWQY